MTITYPVSRFAFLIIGLFLLGNLIAQEKSPLTVIKAIPSPTNSTNDLTFDGTYLYVGGYDFAIFKILPNGLIIDTLITPVRRPYGLTIVNGKLWVANNYDKTIHRINKVTGASEKSFISPCVAYDAGLAWDGSYLWHTDAQSKKLYCLDTNGVVKHTFITPLKEATGLSFDGTCLWIGDNYSNKLYKYNPNTFKYVDTIDSPKDRPNGLAFDGQYLWVAENESPIGADSLFLIDIGAPPISINTQNDGLQITIRPNPSSGYYKLYLEKNYEQVNISIFDISGKEIYSSTENSETITIDLSAEDNGVYLCRITSKGSVYVHKLIKN